MTGPVSLTLTFADLAQAEQAIAAIRALNQPATATKQRENVPTQHEVRPGSTRLGIEQQCDTLGVTAGETATHSRPATLEGADGHPSPSPDALPAGPLKGVMNGKSGQAVSNLKPIKPLRPHCLKPELCAGVGHKHCWSCRKALGEQEAA